MASDTLKLTADELRELENPREECSYTNYYPDLKEEQLLPTLFITNSEHQNLIDNCPPLLKYIDKCNNVDLERLKNLKSPSFRKLKPNSKSSAPLNDQMLSLNNDNYRKLGYRNVERDAKLHDGTYMRPDLKSDLLARGKSLYNSNDFQVCYNMDEQDSLFLSYLNNSFKNQLSMEDFEIIITFFESELYKLARILPPTIKDRNTIDIQQYQRAILYGSDNGTGCNPEEEQECAICGDEESDNSNAIVFCDGCDIAVHQECYGVSFIPEGPWICRRCLILRNEKVSCLFCPSTTGAFKQTDGGDWAHVLCTLWINELYFANPIYMEPIEGINNIPKSRWRLNCFICKRKMGAPIQCSKSSCFQAYHATCAKRAGLYMKMRKGVSGALQNQNSLVTYCDKHSSQEWNRTHDIQTGIQKTKLYFHDLDAGIIKESDNDLVPVTNTEYRELLDTQSSKFQWRLSPLVYIIPEIILDKLDTFLKTHNLPLISRKELNQLAKYYTLKVEKLGQQLIKKPDVFNLATLLESDLDDRQNILLKFNDETGNLLSLANGISKRVHNNGVNIHHQLDTSYKFFQPYQYILLDLISPFIDHLKEVYQFPKYAIKPTINDIITNVKLGKYNDIDAVIDDIERFHNWINKHGSSKYHELKHCFIIWSRCKSRKINKAKELMRNIENWKQINNKGIEIDSNLEIIYNKSSSTPYNKKRVSNKGTSGGSTRTPYLRRKVTRVAKQTGRVLRSSKGNK